MTLDAAASLAASNKRIGNILRKADQTLIDMISEDLLVIEEERVIFKEVKSISGKLEKLYESADYAAALKLLAGLSGSVEAFFDNVMVMDEDLNIRQNRLALLARLKSLFDRVGNLALIG